MYSTCLFCRAAFRSNEALEQLPIGRRIAFDAARGRLWIVCRWCARWNLTPFEERWEAIEECERRFVSTRVRTSSDNIGLARLDEGLELIRIGRPLRPEFAAWRYGGQFLRRYHRRQLYTAGRFGQYGLVGLGPVLAGLFGPVAPLAYAGLTAAVAWRLWRRPALRIGFEGGEELSLNLHHVRNAKLIPDDGDREGWALTLEHLTERPSLRWARIRRRFDLSTAVLRGAEARLVATMVLPRVNPVGGDAATVAEAVRWLEAAGGPERAFRTFARSQRVRLPLDVQRTTLASMHTGVRLALEMALHEEEERRALAGELSVLEWAWRYEEGLAGIADQLGIPEEVERRLGELRRGETLAAGARGPPRG
jgi:hypothetical protein